VLLRCLEICVPEVWHDVDFGSSSRRAAFPGERLRTFITQQQLWLPQYQHQVLFYSTKHQTLRWIRVQLVNDLESHNLVCVNQEFVSALLSAYWFRDAHHFFASIVFEMGESGGDNGEITLHLVLGMA
jgi:hypothetical protein